jgi:hypothetical protein
MLLVDFTFILDASVTWWGTKSTTKLEATSTNIYINSNTTQNILWNITRNLNAQINKLILIFK